VSSASGLGAILTNDDDFNCTFSPDDSTLAAMLAFAFLCSVLAEATSTLAPACGNFCSFSLKLLPAVVMWASEVKL